jgi:hypothetical protein
LIVIVSLPPRPWTWISAVLATVGVPPMTATAPPLTRMFPAALRLTTIELSSASPLTVSWPELGLNVAVVAAFAGTLAPASAPAASAVPASNRAARRLDLGFIDSPVGAAGQRGPARVAGEMT